MSNKADESLPTLEEMKRTVSGETPETVLDEEIFERTFEKDAGKLEFDFVHLKGLEDHYKHKSYWSKFLMTLIGAMFFFQMILLYKVGIGEWSFEKYQWLIPALLVQNLAQIVGLAAVASVNVV
jgi:hypothetical protein